MPSCLIAEDEAIIAMALADGLEEAGHHVLGPFDKGSAVLEALTRLNPDIAVSGHSTARRAKLRGRSRTAATGRPVRHLFRSPTAQGPASGLC